MHFSLHLILEASLENSFVRLTPSMMLVALFFVTLGHPWLASTRSSRRGRMETTTRDLLLPRAAPLLLPRATRWEAPADIALAPPSCMQEVGSSSCHHTTPPPSCDSDELVEMWVVAPPPLCLQVAPPLTCLVPPPPLTYIWLCPHVKEVSSYEHCF
jgi:hypothetical protein